MKKICLFLISSLFASLIHAASMPVASAQIDSHQVSSFDMVASDCHDVTADNHKTFQNAIQGSCHGDAYQCCLGLVLPSSLSNHSSIWLSHIVATHPSSLLIQVMTDPIFKPPKIYSGFTTI